MTSADLAFDQAGRGPAVVLIHGHPFNRSMWAPQVAALQDRYRVIVPDLRGYGESPVGVGSVGVGPVGVGPVGVGMVTMAELAGDIRALLDRVGVGPAALVGLSMGGLVLMELAAAEPDRWWALGFIATTAQPPSPRDAATRLDMARTAEEQGMGPIAEMMGPRLFGPHPDRGLTEQVTAMMLATNPLGAAAALRGRAQRPDYRPVLRTLRTHALVCTGDHDGYSTADVTAELAGCLTDPEVVLLKGAGHLPNLEQTEAFNDHLLAFLDRTRPLAGRKSLNRPGSTAAASPGRIDIDPPDPEGGTRISVAVTGELPGEAFSVVFAVRPDDEVPAIRADQPSLGGKMPGQAHHVVV